MVPEANRNITQSTRVMSTSILEGKRPIGENAEEKSRGRFLETVTRLNPFSFFYLQAMIPAL